jgi:hypothetical protein
MSSGAKKFVAGRLTSLALTHQRVNSILGYIAYCHDQQMNEGHWYSRGWVKENSSDKFENFLKKRLVHNYLKKYKKAFSTGFGSPIEDISFECEPEMPYIKFDKQKKIQKEANDRIDIKVNRLGLQNAWKDQDDQDIYLALECKILSALGDNAAYQGDLQKFCDRNYLQFRLPIEGMIAFKEHQQPGTAAYTTDLNKRLVKCRTIITLQLLKPNTLPVRFGESFFSKHCRNFNGKAGFTVCHLYLDYSQLIGV